MIRHSRIVATMTNNRLAVLLVAAVVLSTATALAIVALMTPNSMVLNSSFVARAAFADPIDLKLKVQVQGQEVIQVSTHRTRSCRRSSSRPEVTQIKRKRPFIDASFFPLELVMTQSAGPKPLPAGRGFRAQCSCQGRNKNGACPSLHSRRNFGDRR